MPSRTAWHWGVQSSSFASSKPAHLAAGARSRFGSEPEIFVRSRQELLLGYNDDRVKHRSTIVFYQIGCWILSIKSSLSDYTNPIEDKWARLCPRHDDLLEAAPAG